MASSTVATSNLLALVLVLALGVSRLAHGAATGVLARRIRLAPCPAGEYSNVGGTCRVCPQGTWQSQIGRNQCFKCNRGTFNNQTGQTSMASCVICPNGTSQPGFGKSMCFKCGPNTVTDVAGQAYCTCAPGFYQGKSGKCIRAPSPPPPPPPPPSPSHPVAITFEDIEPDTDPENTIYSGGFFFLGFTVISENGPGTVSPTTTLTTNETRTAIHPYRGTPFTLESLYMTAIGSDVSVTFQGITSSRKRIYFNVVLLADTVTPVATTGMTNVVGVDISTDGGTFVIDNVSARRPGDSQPPSPPPPPPPFMRLPPVTITFEDIKTDEETETGIASGGFNFLYFTVIRGDRTGIFSPSTALKTDQTFSTISLDGDTPFNLDSLYMTAIGTDVNVTLRGITKGGRSKSLPKVVLLADQVTHVVTTRITNIIQVSIDTDGGSFVIDNVAHS